MSQTRAARPLMNLIGDEIRVWTETAAIVFVIFFAISTLVATRYYIPSESMEPTLEVGDHIVTTKFDYGFSRWSLPFGLGAFLPAGPGRLFARVPRRGDVVVFRHPREPRELIKRVIGLPGDRVELRHGRVIVDGRMLERAFERDVRIIDRNDGDLLFHSYIETLPGGRRHRIYEIEDEADLDNFGPVTVPAGRVFVMGDNRDQSADSRAPDGPGFVPMENLVGRAQTVLFSFRHCARKAGFDCPRPRLWKPLEIKPVPSTAGI